MLTPQEIRQYVQETGVRKVNLSLGRSFVLSIIAGAYIAFAAIGSSVASFALENPSAAALAFGAVFTVGLIMIIVAGGELYTGNTLIAVAVMNKQVTPLRYLLNLSLVLAGNYVGGFTVATLACLAHVPAKGTGALAVYIMSKGLTKMQMDPAVAFFSGILCNLLVSLAVWMTYGAKDISGKVWAAFFPILLFATSGYEHVVANSYFLPAAKLIAQNPSWVALAPSVGESLNQLSWLAQLNSIIPVALGNLIGGITISLIYELGYGSRK